LLIISRSLLLKKRNVSDKPYGENQKALICSIIFFLNRAIYDIMWKNIVDPDRTQMTIWRMRIACWIPKATHTHTHRLWNTNCFSTATVVARTRLNVQFIRTLTVLLFTITKNRAAKRVTFEVRYAMWYNKSGPHYSYGFHFPLPFYPLLLLNVALEYKIVRVQVNQDGLKLNGIHQILVYADDINILGEFVRTVT